MATALENSSSDASIYSVLERLKMRPNLHWEEGVSGQGSGQPLFRLVDETGKVIGSGADKQQVMQRAEKYYVSKLPVHLQTQKEYADNAMIVPLRAATGVGVVGAGAAYAILSEDKLGSANILRDLHNEIGDFYDRQKNASPDFTDVSREDYVANSIKFIMAQPMTDDMQALTIPDGKHIILAKEDVVRELGGLATTNLLHQEEIRKALTAGQAVPDPVLAAYPDLVLEAKPYQMTRAQYFHNRVRVMRDIGADLAGYKIQYDYEGEGPIGGGTSVVMVKPKKGSRFLGAYGPARVKKVSRKASRHYFSQRELIDMASAFHHNSLVEALEEGVVVATEVLADYPGLQDRYDHLYDEEQRAAWQARREQEERERQRRKDEQASRDEENQERREWHEQHVNSGADEESEQDREALMRHPEMQTPRPL